jgi:uncharacterized protein (TIGR02453 family)
MAFRGWPAEAIEFYEGLEADNTRAYWADHKQEYEELVKAPMVELLAELEADFGAGKIFRPYRDVRFSRDKSPYKTAIGATLERGGYVQFSAHGLAAGSGYYVMMPDQLEQYRRAVADEITGGELETLVADLRRAGAEVTAKESLRTAPKGYPKDHPRIELLRHKGLIAWREWPVAAWMGTPKAKQRVVDFFVGARPLTAWLDKHVGPSATPPR